MRTRLICVIGPLSLVFAIIAACAPAARSVAKGEVMLAAQPAVPGAPAGVTAFVDVNVVPMDSERILAHQTVLVEGGWITALGPSNKVPVPVGAIRIDGAGKYLLPGLADMHAHVWSTSRASAEPLLLRYLAHGVTTIRSVDWTDNEVISKVGLELRAAAATGELLSPRIYTGVRYLGTDAPADIATKVAAYKAEGYDFIKVRAESLAVFTALTAAARRAGLAVVGHYPVDWGGDWKEVLSFEDVLASGMQSFEHISPLPPLRDFAQRSARIAALRRAGVWVCPTLGILRMLSVDSLWKPLVRALHQDSGVGLLLGTDGYGQGPAFVYGELAALVWAGLTPYQALLTGTRNVAAYSKTLNEAGTIAAGKRADLVLLSGNPLTQLEAVKQPVGTVLGGRWLPREELEKRLGTSRVSD
jgi:imidazolonepropionase-like amidohydrolase